MFEDDLVDHIRPRPARHEMLLTQAGVARRKRNRTGTVVSLQTLNTIGSKQVWRDKMAATVIDDDL